MWEKIQIMIIRILPHTQAINVLIGHCILSCFIFIILVAIATQTL